MRRWFVPWSGLVVAVLTVLALVGATVPAEARAKRAATSFVYVESDPGDVTGHGLTYLAAQPSATITVQGSKLGPDLLVTAVDGDHTFTFWIDRDTPDHVTTGVHEFGYQNPSRYEFAAALPYGEGSNLSGTMDVRQLEFAKDGHVTRLDLTFSGYDSSFGSGGVRGHIAYRSTKSLELPSGLAVLHGGEWVRGHRELLNAQGLDSGESHGEELLRLEMGGGGQAVVQSRDWPGLDDTYVDTVRWSSPTAGSAADRLTLATDGRLSVRLGDDEKRTVWSVRPKGAGKGTFLLVNYDGRLLLVSPRFKVLWSAG